jgi:hypothetical protein
MLVLPAPALVVSLPSIGRATHHPRAKRSHARLDRLPLANSMTKVTPMQANPSARLGNTEESVQALNRFHRSEGRLN